MRNKSIDFLRGIAVVLTLFRHLNFTNNSEILNILKQIGWIGVDLFFVLSGFLVSGLIFDEYNNTKKFEGKKFLIRRGFKIYPAFWVMIFSTLLFNIFYKIPFTLKQIFAEFFFFQNYTQGLTDHTWSIAIEEHFYFLLVIIFVLILKIAKNKMDAMCKTIIIIIIYGLFAKIIFFFINDHFDRFTHTFPTHFRIDALMYGVLIAYLYRYKRKYIDYVVEYKYMSLLLIAVGLSLPFIWNIDDYPQSMYIFSIGLTMLSISFSLIIILILQIPFNIRFTNNFIFKSIVKIGFYSYSIYLWHFLIRDFLVLNFKWNSLLIQISIYLFLSVFVGIFLGKIIEIPFLKIRDKYFPKHYKLKK